MKERPNIRPVLAPMKVKSTLKWVRKFAVKPKRWILERTLAWFGRSGDCARRTTAKFRQDVRTPGKDAPDESKTQTGFSGGLSDEAT